MELVDDIIHTLKNNTITIVAWVTMIITVLYATVGLFSQIIKNWRIKSCGMSGTMSMLLFLTCFSWLVYALLKNDPYILVSNIPGVFFSFVLLFQFFAYRKNKSI